MHALHPLYLSLRALTDKMPADLQVRMASRHVCTLCKYCSAHSLRRSICLPPACTLLLHETPSKPPKTLLQAQVESAKEALALADVDYDGTMAAKMLIARQLFDREGAALLQVSAQSASEALAFYTCRINPLP